MGFIRNWIMVLNSRGSSQNNYTSARIAALEKGEEVQNPQSEANRPTQPRSQKTYSQTANPEVSPPKRQPICTACSGYHFVVQCPKLAAMNVDDRAKELMEKGLCFDCLQPGHKRGRGCPDPKPMCMICKEPHNTILHGRRPPPPRQYPQRPQWNQGHPSPAQPTNATDAAQVAATSAMTPLLPTPNIAPTPFLPSTNFAPQSSSVGGAASAAPNFAATPFIPSQTFVPTTPSAGGAASAAPGAGNVI